MILLKNKDKKANIKIGNNIEIKDGNDFPFDLTLYGKSTQETSTDPVSPSPEYPSEIENVKGKNLWDNSNYETNLSSGIEIKNNGFKFTRGEQTGSKYIAKKINVVKGKTYTFSAKSNDFGTDNFYLALYRTNVYDIVLTTTIANFLTYTATENEELFFTFIISNTITSVNVSDIQVEKGSVATRYAPYGNIQIVETGKNLFDFNDFLNYSNVTYTKNNGEYSITNIGSATTNRYQLNLLPNTQYTLSCEEASNSTSILRMQIYEESKYKYRIISSGSSEKSVTFTTNSNSSYYLNMTYSGTVAYPLLWKNVMLQKGSTATDYEPYTEEVVNIDLKGNVLTEYDKLIIKDGRAIIQKKSRNLSLAVTDMNNSEDYPGWRNVAHLGEDYPDKNITMNTFCNYKCNIITFSEGGIGLNSMAGGSTLFFQKGAFALTQTQWKEQYPDLVFNLIYELAEPETINLGTVEMPHTYNGVSNITNSADTEMVVKYYKKFEFDKILRGGYNIDEQEYEIAKKQMANGKRKKILSSYVDCIIKIDLGLLDNKTYQEYKEQLEDGEYEYWSYKYNQYKKANFILTKPSITTEYAYDDDIGIDDLEIILEKSGDVDVTS